MPCIRPPWGQLVAVNANTGEILWKSVLGLNERLPAGKQLVGGSGSAGPTVTAGGLVFVGATSDGRFRAFDAKTGKQLWETPLTGAGQRESDDVHGEEREAVRRDRRRRHGQRLRAAVVEARSECSVPHIAQ